MGLWNYEYRDTKNKYLQTGQTFVPLRDKTRASCVSVTQALAHHATEVVNNKI